MPYVIDTIPNSPSGHKLLAQDKKNMWVIAINGEEPITYQGALDKLNNHQAPRGKSKVRISLSIRNSYQRIHLE